MAELITLARPYAKAAFESAKADSDLKGWFEALGTAQAVSQNEKVASYLTSPSATSAEKAKAFCEFCGDALNQKQQNFVAILAENGRLALLPQVFELFSLLKANQEKTVDVEIFTAFALSPELEKKLEATLKVKLERDVELNSSVDESLIGGALIRAGDTVIDGSARGRLAKLAEAMGA